MTEVPPASAGRSRGEENPLQPESTMTPPSHPPLAGDDELADALAAQRAMYTGPITLPVVNEDPTFWPDAADRLGDVPPADPAGDVLYATPAAPVVPDSLPTAPVFAAQEPAVIGLDEFTAEWPVPAPDASLTSEDPLAAFPETPLADTVAESTDPVPASFAPPVDLPIFAPPPWDEPAAAAPQSDEPVVAEPLATWDIPIATTSPLGDDVAAPGDAPFAWAPPVADAPIADAPIAEVPQATLPVDPDEALSRHVEESAATSTLDAILFFENELRRRQGLPATDLTAAPPASVDAAFGAFTEAPVAETVVVDAHEMSPFGALDLGEHDTVEPVRGGEEVPVAAWAMAPPPVADPPPLVEPPAPSFLGGEGLFVPQERVSEPQLPVAPQETLAAEPAFVDIVAAPAPGSAPGPVASRSADPDAEGIDDVDLSALPAPVGYASPAATDPPSSLPAPAAPQSARDDSAATVLRDPAPGAVEAGVSIPSPTEQRAGHATRMFWLWFGANASFVMIAVSATLLTMGMSLRQALVAIVVGVGISALPLGLGTLAGKRSGLPTMVVSRATFGTTGNILPNVLAIVSRVLWAGVTLWLLAGAAATILSSEGVEAPGGTVSVVALATAGVLAGCVAVWGYGLLYRVQRILSILSIVLLLVTVAATAPYLNTTTALATDDGSWVLAIGGAVIVFSVVGLAWAQSSADLARYQRVSGSGAANGIWGSFGVIVPALFVLAWGALLSASQSGETEKFAVDPVGALLQLLPTWFTPVLFGVIVLGLLSATIIAMYSGGLAVSIAAPAMSRPGATIIAAVLAAGIGAFLLFSGSDTRDVARDLATTVAVPVAAWTGIFASETMIRSRRFHVPSLLTGGGLYPSWRWVNVSGLLVASAVGYGFTSASLGGLTWQGYLFTALGTSPESTWLLTDVGVLVALAIGVLLPLVTGIPAIRKQEEASKLANTAEPPSTLVS